MTARALAYLAQQSPRTMLLAMGGIVVFLVLQGGLLLRQPLAEYLQAGRERAALESFANAPQELPAEIARVERELAALQQRLAGASPQLAPEQMIGEVVDRLAAVAARHRAALNGVRPVGIRRTFMYDEMAFDIQAAGAYPALVDWLEDVERELGPLVVTQFSIKRSAAAGALNLELRVAAYRLADVGEAAK